MKRLFDIISCLAAFAGIMVGMSACVPDGFHHRHGGYDPDIDPWRGGGNGGNTTNTMNLEYGYADFYGQYYTDYTDNFLLYLYAGETDADGYFKNSAVMLTLDLLISKTGSLNIASGTYRCSDEGNTSTFIPTYKSKDNDYEGSVLYLQKNKNNYGYYAITDGLVTISRKVTGVYEITADIVTEGNVEYHFTFKGMLDIEDKTQGDVDPVDPENPGDRPLFPGTDEPWKARAQYHGKCVDNDKVDEYTLYLSAGTYAANGVDFVTEGTEIAIEVLTSPSETMSIPAGNYTITSNDPQPFRFYDGWEHDGMLEPSFFYRQYSTKDGDSSLESITSGLLEVNGSGENYSIAFTFGCASGTYKVRYEGGIQFSRDTKSSVSAKCAARASSNGRAMPAMKREVALDRVTR